MQIGTLSKSFFWQKNAILTIWFGPQEAPLFHIDQINLCVDHTMKMKLNAVKYMNKCHYFDFCDRLSNDNIIER